MRPFCSRNRSPSARNRKSNLARSAVRAKWANELNSMWLPDRGSLHTVVLFTPGKCAARCTCLSGLVMVTAPVPRAAVARLAVAQALAVGGVAQAQPPAQGGPLVAAAERVAALQLGHQAPADLGQVVRQGRGPQP